MPITTRSKAKTTSTISLNADLEVQHIPSPARAKQKVPSAAASVQKGKGKKAVEAKSTRSAATGNPNPVPVVEAKSTRSAANGIPNLVPVVEAKSTRSAATGVPNLVPVVEAKSTRSAATGNPNPVPVVEAKSTRSAANGIPNLVPVVEAKSTRSAATGMPNLVPAVEARSTRSAATGNPNPLPVVEARSTRSAAISNPNPPPVVETRSTRSAAISNPNPPPVVEARLTRSKAKTTRDITVPVGIEPDVFASQCRSIAALLLAPSETFRKLEEDFESFKTNVETKISIIKAKKAEKKRQKELKKIQEEPQEREAAHKRLRSSTTDGDEEFGKDSALVKFGPSTPKIPSSFNFSASSVKIDTFLVPANKKLILGTKTSCRRLDETVNVQTPKFISSKPKPSETIFEESQNKDQIESELVEMEMEEDLDPVLPAEDKRILDTKTPSKQLDETVSVQTPKYVFSKPKPKPKQSETSFKKSQNKVQIESELVEMEEDLDPVLPAEDKQILDTKTPSKQLDETVSVQTPKYVFSKRKPKHLETSFKKSQNKVQKESELVEMEEDLDPVFLAEEKRILDTKTPSKQLDETVSVQTPKYVFSKPKPKQSETIFEDSQNNDQIESELEIAEEVDTMVPAIEKMILDTKTPSKQLDETVSVQTPKYVFSKPKSKHSESIFEKSHNEDQIDLELVEMEEDSDSVFPADEKMILGTKTSSERLDETVSVQIPKYVFSKPKPKNTESIFDESHYEDPAGSELGIIEEEEEIIPFKAPPSKANKKDGAVPQKDSSTSSSSSAGSASSFKSAMSSQPISKPPSSSSKFAGASSKQFSSNFMQKQKDREAEAIKKKDAQLKLMKETQKKKNEEWKKKTERFREEQQKKEAALAAKLKPLGEPYVKLTALKQTTSTASAFSSKEKPGVPVLASANFKPNGPMKTKSPVSYPIPKFLTPSAKGAYASPLVAGPSSKVLINKPVPSASTSFLDTTADQTINSYDITHYEDLDEDMKHRENKYVPNWAKDKLGIAANLFRMAPYNDHPRLHTTFPPVKKGFRLYDLTPGQE